LKTQQRPDPPLSVCNRIATLRTHFVQLIRAVAHLLRPVRPRVCKALGDIVAGYGGDVSVVNCPHDPARCEASRCAVGFQTAVWRLSWQTSILQHLFNLITAAAFAFLPIVRALANYRKLVVWQDSGEANDWLVLQVLLAWENGTFFEFSLCLSRACLGKRMHFIYKWLKKCRFLADAMRFCALRSKVIIIPAALLIRTFPLDHTRVVVL
jgi:hypothetical protein